MPTIKDIANEANVSYSTVSYVLGNRRDQGRISDKTRQLVMETAERLGYRKNRLASAIRSGRNNITAVIGEVREDGFSGNVASVLPGIVHAASLIDNSTQIYPDDDLERRVNDILEHRITQVIGVISNRDARGELAELCSKNDLRLVFIYERGQDGFPAVSTDDRLGLRMEVDHLLSLGHRRIALFCASHNFAYIIDRHAGYLDGLAAADVDPRDGFIIHCDDMTPSVVDPHVHRLLSLPPNERPTAFCCIGRFHANAIMRVAAKLGIAVPTELSIVTFGESLATEYAIVPLTTIAQPLQELGGVAFDVLQEKKTSVSPNKAGDYLLPPRLIVRGSTVPVK